MSTRIPFFDWTWAFFAMFGASPVDTAEPSGKGKGGMSNSSSGSSEMWGNWTAEGKKGKGKGKMKGKDGKGKGEFDGKGGGKQEKGKSTNEAAGGKDGGKMAEDSEASTDDGSSDVIEIKTFSVRSYRPGRGDLTPIVHASSSSKPKPMPKLMPTSKGTSTKTTC